MTGNDHDDGRIGEEELLSLLGRALAAHDPVPERVLEGARAAFTWTTIDAELAELVFDSASELAGVRASETSRQVTFRAPGVEIELMVIENGARRLVGQLVPPTQSKVELVASDAVRTTTADGVGRFGFDDLDPGPVRLVLLDAAGAAVVQTEWVLF